MKIFISTYYKYNNYGTRLQNYALQTALESNLENTEVKTIYLKNKKDSIRNLIKKICASLKSSWKNDIQKEKAFNVFNQKIHFLKTTNKKLNLLDREDSIFIAGSDQIWSPTHLENNPNDIDLFLLKFVQKGKKISYAPSFGVEQLPTNLINLYKNGLEDFNHLSIREFTGEKILKQNFNLNAKIVPDPVFLLTQEEWLKIAKRPKQDSYAILYMLGKKNTVFTQSVKEYCNKNNLKIITIAGNDINRNEITATPEEFIGLIKNAEVVFTDSFHACSFSIIFNKKFCVIKRTDVEQFSRIETLLKKYSCEKAIHAANDKITPFKKDNSDIMEKERKIGLQYLEGAISK